MATFTFKARQRDGGEERGVMEAADPGALAARLRDRGLLVLEVTPSNERRRVHRHEPAPPFARKPALQDVENALRQLALLLSSGVSLVESLETIAENSRSRRFAFVARRIRVRVESGDTLHESFARHPEIFSPLVVELVRAGEQSGTLELALERSAVHLEQRRNIRSAVLSAMMYPLLVVVMTSIVAGIMVVKVIPELEKFLLSSHQRLPAITRALLSFTHVVDAYGAYAVTMFLASVVAIIAFERYEPTRAVLDRITFSIPFLRRVRILGSTALFARTLGTLVESGIPLTIALETSERILARPTPRRAIARAREGVLRGDPLFKNLLGTIAFAPMLPRLIRVGEASGSLDRVLLESARFHELELAAWIKRASLIIEPLITILVGSIVGFVYTAFFAALFSLAGGG